ncbi:hypothetical protein C900_01269 [Fulvivirga imtechensis AK7]|uniref:Uncharacterized protein n=1 Tax=Fulvivirga imtechensis AK7 TaxID=1237149 RepID=L8JGK4_9BACT|nr:hypothetical protein [Fulvivirga imtechensis]ELR68006.1 hypothetical protein C900_01269 [Fulvivirga imtechensis AK7]
MIEIFKTNISTKEEADYFAQILNNTLPDYRINFDLEDCDRILRVENRDINANAVIGVFHSHNRYCELLD